jgi:hypothetical protein
VSGSAIEKKASWVKRVLRVQVLKSAFDPRQQAPYKKQTEQLQAALSEQLNLMQAQSNRVAAAGQSNQAIEARIAELISKNDDAIAPADYRECAIQMAPVVEEARRAAEWARSSADTAITRSALARTQAELVQMAGQLQQRHDRLVADKLPADVVVDLQQSLQRNQKAALSPADERVRLEALLPVVQQARKAVKEADDHCTFIYALRDKNRDLKAAAEKAIADCTAALKPLSDPRWLGPLQKRFDASLAVLRPALAVTAPDKWQEANNALNIHTQRLSVLTQDILKVAKHGAFLNDGADRAQANADSPEGQMAKGLGEAGFHEQLAAICRATEAVHAPVGKRLSPGEMVAIYNYTTGDYKKMNGYLLGLSLDSMSDAEKEQYRIRAEEAKKAMAKLPNWGGGMTMRGEYLWPGWEAQYTVGSTFAIKLFWSTSNTTGTLWGDLAINVKGKQGKDVSAVSNAPNEREVLFPPGTKFRVVRRQDRKPDMLVGAKSVITVEEV